MKFLHTGDIHYGATPDANRPWGAERTQAVKETFYYIIGTCKREKTDCLIISGGLFDGCPTDEAVREVNAAFAGIPDTKVYVIAGEDDSVFPASPAASFKWAENVVYNADTKFNSLYPGGMNLEIVGASNDSGRFDPARLKDVRPSGGSASILVLSASDIDEDRIPESFTYVAMGGNHKSYVKRGGHLVNCGSPEPMGPADAGKHGYYVGEIDCECGKITALKYVTLPTVKYITLTVNITPASSEEDVIAHLRREMTDRGDGNIYRIKLSGLCNPEVTFNLNDLKYEFRIDRIDDFTRPDYDYVKLFRDHPSDMVGFFVKEMNRGDISDMDRKALDFGINALLKTADERK